MIPKRFEDIDFTDLEALLNNQVTEGKTIEYKKEIVSNANSDKVPFLAGVSAFANTIGGDFIIGIEAKKGIPVNLIGLTLSDVDAEQQRIEQILQNGLEPRLPSVNVKVITSPNNKNFIFIRANRSWIAPHKVKENDKFYGRNSVGKYPFDVSELRTAFMLTEQLSERIKNFRLERIKKIKENDELPVQLINGSKLIFQLLPLSAFTTINQIDVSRIYEMNLSPLLASGWNKRINLDGVVSYSTNSKNENYSYSQIFKTGVIESTFSMEYQNDEKKIIYINYFENELIRKLKDYIKLFSDLNIEPPVYLFLTFLEIKDYFFNIGNYRFDGGKSDRNDILFPEIVINSFDISPENSLRQLFDMIWNVFGFERCFNYDEEGKRLNNR